MNKQRRRIVLFSLAALTAGIIAQPIAAAFGPRAGQKSEAPMLIDDFSDPGRMSALGTFWRGFTDQVMGGVSTASSKLETIDGRRALRLTGSVSLENNGGFVQVALPLTGSGAPLDVSAYKGIRATVLGNGETYHIHLRTTTTALPWQYYHAPFIAGPKWTTVDLPFDRFTPASIRAKLDPSLLTRIAVVASEKAFQADVAVSKLEFYR
jgi:hypothetical protein